MKKLENAYNKTQEQIAQQGVNTEIYNWLMRQKDIVKPDMRTDVQKLLGKGFDKKKSFRHRK